MQKDYLLNKEKQAEKQEKDIITWGLFKPSKNKKSFVSVASKRKTKKNKK